MGGRGFIMEIIHKRSSQKGLKKWEKNPKKWLSKLVFAFQDPNCRQNCPQVNLFAL
jgi:hypothetical protein